MKFSINIELLNLNISIAAKAVENSSVVPIFSCIRFKVTNDNLELFAYDRSAAIKININDDKFKIEKNGACAIEASMLMEILKKVDSEIATFELLEKDLVLITCGKSKFNIRSLNPNDFDEAPFLEENDKYNLFDSNILKNIVDEVSFLASENKMKPILNGVNFITKKDLLEVCATDTFRLAYNKYNINFQNEHNIVFPKNSLKNLLEIVEKKKVKQFGICFNNNYAYCLVGDCYITFALFDENFPEVLPKINNVIHDKKLLVNPNKLAQIISKASFIKSEGKNYVRLDLSEDNFEIFSKELNISSFNESINEFKFEGEEIRITFEGNFLISALKSFKSDEVIIYFADNKKPIKIVSEDNNLIHFLSPFRDQNW